MSKKLMTELDLEIEQLGSDIDTLAMGIDAHLVENARKLAPKPLMQVQIRALVLGCHVSGARRAGQRTGHKRHYCGKAHRDGPARGVLRER